MNAGDALASSQARFTVLDGAVLAALQAFRQRGENPREALGAIGFSFKERVAQVFASQADPWGAPWADLKPRTKARRRKGAGKGGPQILRDIGLLLNSRAYRTRGARGLDLFLGDSNRPALVHQFGSKSGHIPARPMLPVRPDKSVDLPAEWRDELLDVLAAQMEGSA
jgi:phage virion morphogenesis protein